MKHSNINYTNDVKVLGRVVSIAVDNKVAEAEQVFDTPFKYNDPEVFNIDVNKTGLDQYDINRLFKDRIYAMEAAGLIPNKNTGVIEINKPVVFGNEVTAESNFAVATLNATKANIAEAIIESVKVNGSARMQNLTIDHKLTVNDIEAQSIIVNGDSSLNRLTVNGISNFNNKVNIEGGLDVHGAAKFYDNVIIDGEIGDLEAYLIRLNNKISSLQSTVSILESNITSLQNRVTALENKPDPVIPEPDFSNYYTKSQIDSMIGQLTPGDSNCLWVVSNGKLVPVQNGIDVATSGHFYSGI